MSILVLNPESPEAELSDVDYARLLQHGGSRVLRLDPEVAYRHGGISSLESEVIRLVSEEDVQTVVYTLGMEFDFYPLFFGERLAHVFKVLLLGDDEHFFDVSHRYYAQCFDLVLSTNPLCDRYKLYGIDAWFIPGAFSSKVFCPKPGTAKDIDLSFVGSMRGKVGRSNYVRALENSGIKLEQYGAGTHAGVVTVDHVIEIYRRSRINLNFTGTSIVTPLDAGTSINRRIRQLKGRASKIALCGSFVLSEYAPGIEKIFDIGSEIDVFQDERDLVEKVYFYLSNEELREQMAARSYARAVEEYDEAKFGRQLARRIEARAGEVRRRPYLLKAYFDKPFWSAFGAWRFKYLVLFLFLGKVRLLIKELLLLLRIGRFKPYAAVYFARLGLNAASRTSRVARLLRRAGRHLRRAVLIDG